MNYIEQINGFWNKSEESDLTGLDIAVYMSLLKYCNRLNWLNPFVCHWDIVCQTSKVSKNAYYKSLERLTELGFIKSEKGIKNTTSKPKVFILDLTNKKGIIKEQRGNKEGIEKEQRGNLYKHLTDKQINSILSFFNELKKTDIDRYIKKLVLDDNDFSDEYFISIKNINQYYKDFKGNKDYLLIAYRFWELWRRDNPENRTTKKAKINSWIDTVRLIIEVDNQKMDRLICVLKYFEKCEQKTPMFKEFWFNTIKSIGGLRETNKNGEYRLDTIMKEVNEQIEKDSAFNRLVTDSIDNFKNYNHERN